MAFDPIDDLIAEFRNGNMVVLVDDEDRENEGDLVMPAAHATPEAINFMARYGRGLICLPMTRERCDAIGLKLMVGDNREAQRTQFTVSIDAARGVTTGISAADRANTIRAAAHRDATPSDFVQPGHVFPLMSEPGGVLTRAGHTEAGCDLARLAGLEPAAVLVGDSQRGRDDGPAPGPGAVRAGTRSQARDHRRPDPVPDAQRKDSRSCGASAGCPPSSASSDSWRFAPGPTGASTTLWW